LDVHQDHSYQSQEPKEEEQEAEAGVFRDFLLKTGLKSDFGPVEPEQGVAKSNWAYTVSSGSA
jgi:hypothetical protein